MESQGWKGGVKKKTVHVWALGSDGWEILSFSKDERGACYAPGWVGQDFREE